MKLYIVVNTIASTLRESFVMLQEAYWTVSYTRSVVLSSCRPQHRARSSRQANGLPYSLSPMLQILSLNIRLAWFNYDRINFSVQDVHFGLAYLERLPKSLQKVTFHVDEQVFCRFYRRKLAFYRQSNLSKANWGVSQWLLWAILERYLWSRWYVVLMDWKQSHAQLPLVTSSCGYSRWPLLLTDRRITLKSSKDYTARYAVGSRVLSLSMRLQAS